MKQTILTLVANHPYGFTYSLFTLTLVSFGIVVAYDATQNTFDANDLDSVLAHALQHEMIIGGWLNTQNNLFYFDSCRLFRNNELQQAIRFAKENNQIAIFDLTNKLEIKIE